MIRSEATAYPFYIPHGNNKYPVELTSVRDMGYNVFTCPSPYQVTITNRFETFDDDPLTPDELADLEESYRDLSEGRYEILSRELSDDEFFANF